MSLKLSLAVFKLKFSCRSSVRALTANLALQRGFFCVFIFLRIHFQQGSTFWRLQSLHTWTQETTQHVVTLWVQLYWISEALPAAHGPGGSGCSTGFGVNAAETCINKPISISFVSSHLKPHTSVPHQTFTLRSIRAAHVLCFIVSVEIIVSCDRWCALFVTCSVQK